MRVVKKHELYYADLSPVVGSEQGGIRPVMILQNDMGNKHSPTTIVGVITTRKSKAEIPTHLFIGKNFGLSEESIALFEQIRTIDKKRLRERIGQIDDALLISKVDKAIHISLGLS